ncbi:hypothetical protein SCA6_017670 [Theobroma cacao]
MITFVRIQQFAETPKQPIIFQPLLHLLILITVFYAFENKLGMLINNYHILLSSFIKIIKNYFHTIFLIQTSFNFFWRLGHSLVSLTLSFQDWVLCDHPEGKNCPDSRPERTTLP